MYPEEGIEFAVRTSKATSVARPMSLKKIIASELVRVRDKQRAREGGGERAMQDSYYVNQSSQFVASQGAGAGGGKGGSQSQGGVGGGGGVGGSQSQGQGQGKLSVPKMGNIGLEGDITSFTKYVAMVPKKETTTDIDGDIDMDSDVPGKTNLTMEDPEAQEKEIEYEEKEMDKENLVKAYKFGNTWVPMEGDAFPDMETKGGIDVLGFVSSSGVSSASIAIE